MNYHLAVTCRNGVLCYDTLTLSATIEAAFAAGQRAWPGSALSVETFAGHVARLQVAPEVLLARAPDLFIAAACANGDELALRRFETQYLAGLAAYVARWRLSDELLTELRQQTRIAILVGRDPMINRYRAAGPLGAWVRVIAVRTAMGLIRATRADQRRTELDAVESLIASDLGPEGHAARAMYRGRLARAVKDALSGLNDRERTVLRLNVLEGLSTEAIGRIYQVHKATAARWLVSLQTRLRKHIQAELRLRDRGSSSELRSLVRLLEGDVDLSLRRILADGEKRAL
jgi:RNA polymerase sigma-70 factor (ECF subfamily)